MVLFVRPFLQHSRSVPIPIVLLHLVSDHFIRLLCVLQGISDHLQTHGFIVDGDLTRLVLLHAKMLDLFARVADLVEAKGGGGAFEEVAERGQGFEVSVFAVDW